MTCTYVYIASVFVGSSHPQASLSAAGDDNAAPSDCPDDSHNHKIDIILIIISTAMTTVRPPFLLRSRDKFIHAMAVFPLFAVDGRCHPSVLAYIHMSTISSKFTVVRWPGSISTIGNRSTNICHSSRISTPPLTF